MCEQSQVQSQLARLCGSMNLQRHHSLTIKLGTCAWSRLRYVLLRRTHQIGVEEELLVDEEQVREAKYGRQDDDVGAMVEDAACRIGYRHVR